MCYSCPNSVGLTGSKGCDNQSTRAQAAPVKSKRFKWLVKYSERILYSVIEFRAMMVAMENTRKIGFVIVILFSLSVFVSKSAMNIFGAAMFALSLYFIFRYKSGFFNRHRYLAILLLPIAVGLLVNLLSPEGFKGAFNLLNRFKYVLVFIPLAVFIEEKRQLNAVLGALLISGLIGVSYSILYTRPPYFRVLVSIMGLGRNADMLMAAALLGTVFLLKYPLQSRNQKLIFRSMLILLITLFLACILLEANLGAWLGLAVGLVVFAILYERKLLVVLFAVFIVVWFAPQTRSIKNEMLTIVQFEEEPNVAIRLHMWKTGIDFVKGYPLYGTGKKKPAEYFLEFFERQPEEYQKK